MTTYKKVVKFLGTKTERRELFQCEGCGFAAYADTACCSDFSFPTGKFEVVTTPVVLGVVVEGSPEHTALENALKALGTEFKKEESFLPM